jgi:hypothetical protein
LLIATRPKFICAAWCSVITVAALRPPIMTVKRPKGCLANWAPRNERHLQCILYSSLTKNRAQSEFNPNTAVIPWAARPCSAQEAGSHRRDSPYEFSMHRGGAGVKLGIHLTVTAFYHIEEALLVPGSCSVTGQSCLPNLWRDRCIHLPPATRIPCIA